jgi:hypothetical protein
MRTTRARRLLRRGLFLARVRGHRPKLISHSGALKLYGCLQGQNCQALLECWDNPDNVAGPMLHADCIDNEIGWIRKLVLKLIY